jgi:hypothetical protein
MLSGEATEALAAAKPDGAEVAQRAMKDEAFRNRMRLKIEDQESLASRMAQRRLDSARKRELAMESNRTAREAEGAPTPPGEVSEVSELRTEQPVSRNVRAPVAVMRDDEEAMAQYETDMRAWREAKALALIEQAREEERSVLEFRHQLSLKVSLPYTRPFHTSIYLSVCQSVSLSVRMHASVSP